MYVCPVCGTIREIEEAHDLEITEVICCASQLMSAFERVRITITGVVQGVGFRPFIYRLAAECGIKGMGEQFCSRCDY